MNIIFSDKKESPFFQFWLLPSIVILGLTLVAFVNPLMVQPNYGLTVIEQGIQPVQLPTTDQNFTGNITGFTEYVGFDKDFSLQYPSSWTLEPKTNRFESIDLKMSSPDGVSGGIIIVGYYLVDPALSSSLKQIHAKQKDIEKYLVFIFPRVLSGFANNFDNFNAVEEPDYVKYQIDGHRTGSAVFGYTLNDQNLAGLLVWTLIGGNQFWLQYTASQDTFDQNLPIAEKVLSSIKILPK